MDQNLQFAEATPAFLDQLGTIAAQTFDFPEQQFATFCERVGSENLRVATEGDRVVGGMAAYQFGQWFGGRCIPMAGIALVCVAPEARASGMSQFMMLESLREHRQQNVPLAALFASTQRPYRKVGFEQAGHSCLWELPMSQIGRHEQLLPVRRVDMLAPNHFSELAEYRARITNGNLQRTDGAWQRLFDSRNNPTPVYGYLVGQPGAPDGYLIHEQITLTLHDRIFFVRDMAAKTVEAARSLWALIHDHRSIFERVQWTGGMRDSFVMTTAEFQPKIASLEHWMLRIIDVQLALQMRGYPNALNCQLDFELHDNLMPENCGRFRLTVANGTGNVQRRGDGHLQIDVRGLASLFTGFCDAASLQTAGLLSGPSESIELANLIFSGPESWMPDRF